MNAYTNSRTESIFKILKQGKIKTDHIPLFDNSHKTPTNQKELKLMVDHRKSSKMQLQRNSTSPCNVMLN
jgi:hypothetical protein